MNEQRARAIIRDDEKAEMGVGTLIVFIAMILVAAVAATVLITTAFKMQQQAEHTGDITIADVATGFRVINVAGDRYNPDDDWNGNRYQLEIIELKVGLLAGSPDINVSDVIIEVSDGNSDITLVYVDTDDSSEYNDTATGTQFTVQPLRDMAPVNDTKSYAMMTPGDVAKFFINANATNLELLTQTSCHIKIIPKHGIPTLETFVTPSVYTTRYMQL